MSFEYGSVSLRGVSPAPSAAIRYLPAVAKAARDAERRQSDASEPKADTQQLQSSSDQLQKDRAAALSELQDVPAETGSKSDWYKGLDRDQLASIVYDRKSAFSLSDRATAKTQLETNDNAFLQRAGELSEISGDDRVLLNAKLGLEVSKSPIERAVPKSEAGTSVADLKQQIAEKTAELGGGPVGITLRYPNGWAAAGSPLPLPAVDAVDKVSPGATRVALLYRENLF